MTPLKPKGRNYAKATRAHELEAACSELAVGEFVARTGTYRVPVVPGLSDGTEEVAMSEFALKVPGFNWKMLATTGSLTPSTKTKRMFVVAWLRAGCGGGVDWNVHWHVRAALRHSPISVAYRYDRNTDAVVSVNYPEVFAAYSANKHAVDDNNRMRQAVGNFAAAWKAHRPLKRHLLTLFAFAETNALAAWNFLHPTTTHSKTSWQEVLLKAMLEGGDRRPAAEAAAAVGRNCALKYVPSGHKFDPARGAFVPISYNVRRYCANHLMFVVEPLPRSSMLHAICCGVQWQRLCAYKDNGVPCTRRVRTYCACEPRMAICQEHFHSAHLGMSPNSARRYSLRKRRFEVRHFSPSGGDEADAVGATPPAVHVPEPAHARVAQSSAPAPQSTPARRRPRRSRRTRTRRT